MHPSISQFPSSAFYHKKIRDAPDVKHKTYEKRYLPGRCFCPYSFINVPLGKEEMDDDGHSRRNMVEVALVMKMVRNLYEGIVVLTEPTILWLEFFPEMLFCLFFLITTCTFLEINIIYGIEWFSP